MVVRELDGTVTTYDEVDVECDGVERLLTALFTEHWAAVTVGPLAEGGSCAPTTWGLGLWNGRAEQMITILFPSPHFDEWRRLPESRWERTELWRALRRRYTGTG